MALGAVLAAALTNHAVHPNLLSIHGVDVILATDIGSIRVVEAGPGEVSTMTMIVDDPTGALRVMRGDDVRFMDLTHDRPRFVGWVSRAVPSPWPPTGQKIYVECVGPESALDWVKVGALTLGANRWGTADAIQVILGAAVNGIPGPLRAFQAPFGAGSLGSIATPISDAGSVNPEDLTIAAGTSLREAIRLYIAAAHPAPPDFGWRDFVTVDFYFGLRYWRQTAIGVLSNAVPDDYTGLTVTDTAAGALATSNLQHELDATAPAGVYVVGTGVAVAVSDGTGVDGDTAVISDPNIDTVTKGLAAAAAYLADYSAGSLRGSFDIDHSATLGALATVHPESILTLTDDLADATGTYRIESIERTYEAGATLEGWTVHYGGRRGSLAAAVRRLTRSALS